MSDKIAKGVDQKYRRRGKIEITDTSCIFIATGRYRDIKMGFYFDTPHEK